MNVVHFLMTCTFLKYKVYANDWKAKMQQLEARIRRMAATISSEIEAEIVGKMEKMPE